MLQALLAERFKLALRHETKQLPVYTWSWQERIEDQETAEEEKGRAAVRRTPGMVRFDYKKTSIASLAATLANLLGSPYWTKPA